MPSKENLYAKLEAKVKKLDKMRQEIEAFCDANKLTWHYTPVYGMGGTYSPYAEGEKHRDPQMPNYGGSYREEGGWLASSLGC